MGVGDGLDHHRARVGERRARMTVQKEMPIDSYFVTSENALVDENGVLSNEVADVIGEVMSVRQRELRTELRDEIDKLKQVIDELRIKVASLEGELRGLRAANANKLWRPGDGV